jgi:NADH:ubiquinone oxidoreductase subunit 4 (subunit M)
VLAVGIIYLGVLPSPVLEMMSSSVSSFSLLFTGGAWG